MDKINILYSPFNKPIIFTIIDDTDYARYEYIKPIYDEIREMGIKVTKTVWVKDCIGKWGNTTDTTNNPKYRDYLKQLQCDGFEIGLHCVSGESNLRESIIEGYEIFKNIFSHYPKTHVMHSFNQENFEMVNKNSKYFWGDIYQKKGTKYTRVNKYTRNINTLNTYKFGTNSIHIFLNNLKLGFKNKIKIYKYLSIFRKKIVFYDQRNPYVTSWFCSSYGNHKTHFLNLLSNQNINQLIEEKGVSIVFTHFACGFCDANINGEWVETQFEKLDNCGWTQNGWDTSLLYRLNPKIKQQLQKIVGAGAWCVPVHEVLDRYLLLQNIEIRHMQRRIIIRNNNNRSIDGLAIQIKSSEPIGRLKIGEVYLCYCSDDGQFFVEEIGPNQEIAVDYEHGIWDRNIPKIKVPNAVTLKKAFYDGLKMTILVDKKCIVEISKASVKFYMQDIHNCQVLEHQDDYISFIADPNRIYNVLEIKN